MGEAMCPPSMAQQEGELALKRSPHWEEGVSLERATFGHLAQPCPCPPTQVFLHGSQGQVYHSQQVGPPGSAISPDLLLDSSDSHLYVLTAHQVRAVLGLKGPAHAARVLCPLPLCSAAPPGGPDTCGGLSPVP